MKFLNNVEISGSLTVGGTNIKTQLSTLQTNINTVSNTVNTVSANANKIKTYVGSDGKLHFVNASGADTALNFSSSGEIKNILHYQFGGISAGKNRYFQLNYSNLSAVMDTLDINTTPETDEYSFPNWKYTSSLHAGDIVTKTGGEFIIIYDKGLAITEESTKVQKITALAGETIFSKQTGNENFRVIVIKLK